MKCFIDIVISLFKVSEIAIKEYPQGCKVCENHSNKGTEPPRHSISIKCNLEKTCFFNQPEK